MERKNRHIVVDYEKLSGAMRRRVGKYAELKKVHRNTVSNWINGRVRLTFDDLNEIADFLGRDADEFIEIKIEVEKTPDSHQLDMCIAEQKSTE